jgi:hypothetical protein
MTYEWSALTLPQGRDRDFSKETLQIIEVCIVHKVDLEATMSLMLDCSSALSPETDLPSFLSVFEQLENSQVPELVGLLHS